MNMMFAPSPELRRLQREFDRLFDGFLPARPAQDPQQEAAAWSPRVDLAETEDAYLIALDAPGISREHIEIHFHDGALSVSGRRDGPEAKEGVNHVRCERVYGPFYRAFALPKSVDPGRIEASYQEGVLSIRAPKAEESKPRRIEVR